MAEKRSILCFGDSLTWGWIPVKESAPTLRYPYAQRWTGAMAAKLGEDYHIIEEGLSARTTSLDDPNDPRLNGSAYLPAPLASHLPLDLVIILLGTNDTKSYFPQDALRNRQRHGQAGRPGADLGRRRRHALSRPKGAGGNPRRLLHGDRPRHRGLGAMRSRRRRAQCAFRAARTIQPRRARILVSRVGGEGRGNRSRLPARTIATCPDVGIPFVVHDCSDVEVRYSYLDIDHTAVFEKLAKWGLVPDGDPIVTRAARLLPVLRRGEPAVLKLSFEDDERLGGAVMEWWDGDGAASVLAPDEHALLLERATGLASLSDMARTGQDDEACRILCRTAARLHAPRAKPSPNLMPLAQWFRELAPAANTYGGILSRCAATADMLLRDEREIVVLHGDLHHGNVLDFGERGWLAIDPKHIWGERGFDFANIFTNPDLADPTRPVATEPGRFARRLEVVTEAAKLDRFHLLCWILAWTGLSAAWFLSDDDPMAEIDLHIARLAAAEIDRMC